MGGVMSAFFSWLWPGPENSVSPSLGPDADKPHPETGLTPRHCQAILTTWDMVRPDLKTHGILFFIRLFKSHPETQLEFRGLAGIPPDDLRHNKRLAAHGNTVMLAFSAIVDNLDDVETLKELLKTTGINHKRRGVNKAYFEFVKSELLLYLRDTLGGAWTPTAEEGWTQALTVVNTIICSAYED